LLVLFAVGFRKRREPRLDRLEWPLVSICVPAFDEAQSIRAALQSLIALDYPNFEVIVVDDGSTDNTFALASAHAGTYPWGDVHVYRKPNGGKWSAHNFAFQRTKGDIILCIDVDSRLDADALRRGVARLLDDDADAVAGFARVWNRDNLLTNLQALEYVVWNGAVRLPQSVSGDVVCVPGPLGFFRRTALEEVFRRFGDRSASPDEGTVPGPYQGDTFAEDLDLSLAIVSLGGKIVAEPLCACDTVCPDSVFGLMNQRYRWSRGSIQAIAKCLRRAWNHADLRQRRLLAWLSCTYVFDMAAFLTGLTAYFAAVALALTGDERAVQTFAVYLAAQMTVNVMLAAIFIVVYREKFRLLLFAPLLDFYGMLVLGSVMIVAVIDELRGARMRW